MILKAIAMAPAPRGLEFKPDEKDALRFRCSCEQLSGGWLRVAATDIGIRKGMTVEIKDADVVKFFGSRTWPAVFERLDSAPADGALDDHDPPAEKPARGPGRARRE